MMETDSTELLTTEGLAEALKVTPETIRSWARRGMIPKIQFTPKVTRYELSAVVEHVKQIGAA